MFASPSIISRSGPMKAPSELELADRRRPFEIRIAILLAREIWPVITPRVFAAFCHIIAIRYCFISFHFIPYERIIASTFDEGLDQIIIFTIIIAMTTIFDESSTDSKSSCSQAYHHQLLHSRNSWTQQSLTSPSSHSSSSHSYLSSTQRCRHRVCFSSVDVIEFSIILGDHPACRTGPALQTSNRVVRRMSFTFDDYEKERLPKRRSIENLYLTSEQRKELL